MKLLSLIVYRWNEDKAIQLSAHLDLSHFNFFQRGTIKEHVVFHSRLVCSRTPLGTRQTVEFQQNLGRCYVFVHASGLAAAVLTDQEYPMRVAFSLISQVLRDFQEKFGNEWTNVSEDTNMPFPEGDALLQKYQNPMEADKLLKVHKELDEVKDVMLKNIDDLFKRGETLDALMAKSEDLSQTSYEFYRTAKKNNQCCSLY